ncbi:unnamed protein product, partial [Gongylonema pulchrum]|uniref:UBA domain-containing protein n=1 Tax=Gongylonema pulchrum TaxID=637853 RepID=A0A183ECI1_9BILA
MDNTDNYSARGEMIRQFQDQGIAEATLESLNWDLQRAIETHINSSSDAPPDGGDDRPSGVENMETDDPPAPTADSNRTSRTPSPQLITGAHWRDDNNTTGSSSSSSARTRRRRTAMDTSTDNDFVTARISELSNGSSDRSYRGHSDSDSDLDNDFDTNIPVTHRELESFLFCTCGIHDVLFQVREISIFRHHVGEFFSKFIRIIPMFSFAVICFASILWAQLQLPQLREVLSPVFIRCYRFKSCLMMYGNNHPHFFSGSLQEAVREAFEAPGREAAERRPLAVLCSDVVASLLKGQFVTWPWDMTQKENRQKLFEWMDALNIRDVKRSLD